MQLAPSSLVVARRALVIAVASLAVAVAALAVVLWGDSDSDPAESGAAQAQTDAAAALAEAQAAVAMAEVAAADIAAVENALAAALAAADGAVSPEIVADLDARLEQARSDAAAALAAANAAAASLGEASAADEAAGDGAAVDEAPAPVEEAPVPEDGAGVEDEAGAEDAPLPEDDGEAVPLPGEPFDLGPSEGAGLAVVGIRSDSGLNVRDVPNGEIIARLDNVMDGARDPAVYVRAPDTDDIITTVDLLSGVVATGNSRQLPTTIWHEFQVGDLTGWSSAAYLAQAGATDDATAAVVDSLGETPEAATLLALGLAVAQTMASEEPASRVVVSEAPGASGDLAQMTVDVIDLGDDSVLGYRLVVFAVPAEEVEAQDDPGPFTLKSVERTFLCHSHRGVSEEGLCL